MTGAFLLQRQLAAQRGQWRTVVAFSVRHIDTVLEAATRLSSVDAVEWRIVVNDHQQSVVASTTGGQWGG